MNKFNHLSLWERQRIQRYLRQEKSLRFIAEKLDRTVSCISDEIKNNSVNGHYDAKKAHHKAYMRRKNSKIQCLKVAADKDLRYFVTRSIEDDQSPEGISGRLKCVEKNIKYASTKAIYKFVHSIYGRQIEKHLYSKSVKKKGGPKRGQSVSIDGRIMIDKRPKRIEKRVEFGHYELDFIESGKDGKGSLLVLVERKTRYPFIEYLKDRDTKTVNNTIDNLLLGLPIKSITADNDLSLQKHKELSELLNTIVFFCHPQSPYEKGTVENRNKAIRRYAPRRSDLSKYRESHFKMIEGKLRNKFMKCLNYKTPKEVFNAELEKQKIPLDYGMILGDNINKIINLKSVRIEGYV